jgi:hypothetical protein
MPADILSFETQGGVREFVSAALGCHIDPLQLMSTDERRLVARALSRSDELDRVWQSGERRAWSGNDVSPEERVVLQTPQLDGLLAQLRARLPAATTLKPRWPDGRRFAVCLTHDMDHVTGFPGAESRRRFVRSVRQAERSSRNGTRLLSAAVRSSLSTWVKRDLLKRVDHHGHVADWLRLEASCGYKSSFYFFAQTIEPWHQYDCDYGFADRVMFDGHATTVGKMMREISGRGWEVSLHGSIASATEPGVLQRQKQEIESELGRTVRTTRQHYLQYDARLTSTLQSAAGFVADGTHGFNDLLGCRAGTTFPYRVWSEPGKSLLPLYEIPLHVQDGPLLRGTKSVAEAVAECVRWLDMVCESGGCLGLLFHPSRLATERGFAVYREVLEEARHKGAWGCSMEEAVDWWQAHVKAVTAGPIVAPTRLNNGSDFSAW